MELAESDLADEVERARVAQEMRRLGQSLAGKTIPDPVLREVTAALVGLADRVDGYPPRDKRDDVLRRARWGEFKRTGVWPGPVDDGAEISFDRSSLVGGPLSPFGMGATFRREGDEAVGRVTLGPAFEGPPGRVHGGNIAAIMDEVMGTVLSVVGAMAYTGRLTVSFLGPAPLRTELVFRARLAAREGRKLHLECVGRAGEVVFARGEGIWVEVDPAVALEAFESGAESG